MWTAVFLVIMGLLVGMYLTATPDKMKTVIEKRQKIEAQKKKIQQEKNRSALQSKDESAPAGAR
jgi:hypothetical protein